MKKETLLEKYSILSSKLQKASDSDFLYFHLGATCLELGYTKEALVHFKKAIELNQENYTAIIKFKKHFSPQEFKEIESTVRQRVPFWKELKSLARYPLAKEGKFMVISGATIFSLLNSIPISGFLLCLILVVPYLMAYMLKIISKTAEGEKDIPNWPDITVLWYSFLQFLSALLISFCPFILLNAFKFFSVFSIPDELLIVCFILGFIYLPIALISVALFKNALSLLNYPFLIKSIFKIKKDYFFSLMSMLIVTTLLKSVTGLLTSPTMCFGKFLFWFILLYLIPIQMYIFGNIYFINEKKLRWFK